MSNANSTENELILLGTGTSTGVPLIGCHCDVCQSDNPRNHRTRTGVAVRTSEGIFLIDAAPELRLQLVREKIGIVEAVVFTHGHADHVFGLDDLRIVGLRLQHAVPLYCEERVETSIRKSFYYAFARPENDHVGAIPHFEFHRIGMESFDIAGVSIQPIRLWHGRTPVLGFRLNDIAFCTDVSHIPNGSWPLLENLDVLILDALREKPHPTHFCLDESLRVVERLKPRQTYFTHISHSLEYNTINETLPPNVQLAYDGLHIPF